MEYSKIKEEQAKRLERFRNRDSKLWKKVRENCTMCESDLICFDVWCAMIAVGNEIRMEGIKNVREKA